MTVSKGEMMEQRGGQPYMAKSRQTSWRRFQVSPSLRKLLSMQGSQGREEAGRWRGDHREEHLCRLFMKSKARCYVTLNELEQMSVEVEVSRNLGPTGTWGL